MIVIIIAVTIALLACLWGIIRAFFIDEVSPWIEQHCGEKARSICCDVFSVANHAMTLTRRGGKALWNSFCEIIKKSDVEYRKQNSNHFKVSTKTVIKTQGGYRLQEKTETIHEANLPNEIRRQMYEKNADQASVDNIEAIRKKYEDELINED